MAALDAVKDPIFVHDAAFRVVRANAAYAARAGMRPDEFLGKPYWEVFPKDHGPLPGCSRALLKHGTDETEELTTAEGNTFNSRSFAVHGDDGRYLYSVHILEDITERKRIEAALRGNERHFRQIVETSQEGIWQVDTEGRTTYVNDRLAALLGYDVDELQGRPFFDYVAGEGGARVARCWQRCIGGSRGKNAEQITRLFSLALRNCLRSGRRAHEVDDVQLVRKNGAPLWTTVSIGPIFDDDGALSGVLAMLTDITDRRRAIERLYLAAQVFNSAAEAIMILDAERRVIDVNSTFTAMTGYLPRDVLGLQAGQPKARTLRNLASASLWKALETQEHWRGEVIGRRKSGQSFPQLLNVNVVRNRRGELVNYIVVFNDITDLKASQERLEYIATHDRLTGLPNRNLFHDRLQHGLDTAARHGERLAVLFVDLDNFKSINDTLGHEVGDELLIQVADRLRASTRKEDTIGRLGGDEFTVLTENIEAFEEVPGVTAERILEVLAAPFDLKGHEVLVSASVGIALHPKDGRDVATLLKNADAAMYRAKESGKNNFHFFTEEMNVHATERLALENALRRALRRQEFFLVYQPLLALDSARIVGVEALLRWQHPERGVLLPEEFMPVAENTGLIVPIGDWVLQTACRQLREWLHDGAADVRLAVNMSARQFRQKDLPGVLRRIIEENRVPPSSVEIELTESTLMEDAETAAEVLGELKDKGVRLAIDNFGTGRSSLRYLQQFPIDHLKIDGHFTRDLVTNPNDQAIANAIITMGHSLQIAVVGEGVETRQQLDFLKTRGCDIVQGYYVDKPLPPEKAAAVLGTAWQG